MDQPPTFSTLTADRWTAQLLGDHSSVAERVRAGSTSLMALASLPDAYIAGMRVGFCPGCTYWARLYDREDGEGHCVSTWCGACRAVGCPAERAAIVGVG